MKHQKTSGNRAASPETTISSPVVSKSAQQQQQLPLPPTQEQLAFTEPTESALPAVALERWVTAKAVMDHFGMSERTLRSYVADQKMPIHFIGKRQMRFKISEVQAFLDKLGAERFAAIGRGNSLAEARKRLVVIPVVQGVKLVNKDNKGPTKSKPLLTPKCKVGRKLKDPKRASVCDREHHRWRTRQYTRTCSACGRTEERDAANNWSAVS